MSGGSGSHEHAAAKRQESRPRLLDLFCGAGGAAMGYHRAGFDVVGVDIAPQPNYPFEFERGDALSYMDWFCGDAPSSDHSCCRGHSWFDAIHASPPCQAYTNMSNRWRGKDSLADARPSLIAETRDLLNETGLPWVIENVAGALRELRNPTELTGEMFGLRVHRPRLFETSGWLLLAPYRPLRQLDPVAVYGKDDQRRLWTRTDGSELRAATLEDGSAAMGIDWMGWRELCEAIPPAYTEYVGEHLIRQVRATVAA